MASFYSSKLSNLSLYEKKADKQTINSFQIPTPYCAKYNKKIIHIYKEKTQR